MFKTIILLFMLLTSMNNLQSNPYIYNMMDSIVQVNYDLIIKQLDNYVGIPYRYGGTTWKGFDCSALIRDIYKRIFDIKLPRTSKLQSKVGYVVQKRDLIFGDLVFFNTKGKKISHVGMFIKDSIFIHASTKGVKYSSLQERYYNQRYVYAKRVLN